MRWLDPHGLQRYTNTYSRSNDDPEENNYETAKIEVTLDVDTSGCSYGCGTNPCFGKVKLKFEYKATASTDHPDFRDRGPLWRLRSMEGEAEARLAYAEGGQEGIVGNTLSASVALPDVDCKGGEASGVVVLQVRSSASEWAEGTVQSRMSWSVKVTQCGKISDAQIRAEHVHDTGARNAGRVATTYRHIGSSYETGEFEQPWPTHPGEPR